MSLLKNVASTGRRMAKAVYLRLLFFTGLLRWARSRVARRGVVVITLHRVLPDEQYDPVRVEPGMALRASTFQHLLDYLARRCQPALPGAVFHRWDRESPSAPRVALTFDDGWKDNFETAFPLSRKFGVPFTVFICPQMIGGKTGFWPTTVNRLWWAAHDAGKLELLRSLCAGPVNGSVDSLIENIKRVSAQERDVLIARLQAALKPADSEQEQLLSWDDVRKMANAGIAFGSHTNTHAILTAVSDGDAEQELTASKSAIEAQLSACPWLAYPNGDCSKAVRNLAAQAGYQAAFANSPGIWEASTDRFSIPRVNLWEGSLTGAGGRFSRIALEYAVFWKAYRARRHPGAQ